MRGWAAFAAAVAALLFPCLSQAHFGLIVPSRTMIMSQREAPITLDVAFAHPFSRQGMDMEKPEKFFVRHDGGETDLTASLAPAEFYGKRSWKCDYKVARPGVYLFGAVPRPYYEPAEDSFIIHYVKTAVAAFGGEDGWGEPLGLPVEIIPLARPFGNYPGDVFVGRVLHNGKPVPGATVEIECLNEKGERSAPNAYFETQAVVADADGVFVAGIPWAGWWGFAALVESPEKMARDGEAKDVELGGVLWAYFTEPQFKK